MRSIPQSSVKSLTVAKVSTKSAITVLMPRNYQLSVLPLTGSYRIKCALPNNQWNTTVDISVYNATSLIADRIVQACPNYREKFEIWNGPAYYYNEDGRDLLIRFTGLNQDVPQMEVVPSPTNPLVGNEVSLNQSIWVPYNPTTLFYEPVPFEFLHTAESKP